MTWACPLGGCAGGSSVLAFSTSWTFCSSSIRRCRSRSSSCRSISALVSSRSFRSSSCKKCFSSKAISRWPLISFNRSNSVLLKSWTPEAMTRVPGPAGSLSSSLSRGEVRGIFRGISSPHSVSEAFGDSARSRKSSLLWPLNLILSSLLSMFSTEPLCFTWTWRSGAPARRSGPPLIHPPPCRAPHQPPGRAAPAARRGAQRRRGARRRRSRGCRPRARRRRRRRRRRGAARRGD